MNNKVSGVQIFAILSLGVCAVVALVTTGVALQVWFVGIAILTWIDIFGGYFSKETAWTFVLWLFLGYGVACLAMFAAAVGLLLRQRWGRILALLCLPPMLLASIYMSVYSLPYLWAKSSSLEAAWHMETILLLMPAAMVLYCTWGLVQIIVAKPDDRDF